MVSSVRGQLVSIINLKTFLGLANQGLVDTSKLIIVRYKELELGLLVDEVQEVIQLFQHQLTDPLAIQNQKQGKFTLGLAQGSLVVLDIKALLQSQDIIVR